MGIKNLQKVISENAPNAITHKLFKDYNHKIIAIDTSIILYQFVIAIRNSGADLQNKDGKSTSHIQGILSKAINMLENKIKPIFVYDGKPSSMKMKVINDRKQKRDEASNKISNGLDKDNEIKEFKKMVSISKEQSNETKEILELLGVPYMDAIEEADSMCAELVKQGISYGTSSEDMDILTFGSNKLLRNFNPSKKKTDFVIEIDLKKVLSELNITYEQFIDLCILLGSDYNDPIKGIGKKGALEKIKKYGSIDKLLESEPKHILPDRFDYKTIREYFMNASNVKINNNFKWKRPKYEQLKNVLVDKYSYNSDKVDNLISRIKKIYADYGKYEYN